ncbi:MAG: type I-B CRISPR-associated protein Cas7/Cst2/DevR, partial [Oscillospiraceae bacterium]
LTNMGLSKRIDNGSNGIAQSEIHHSMYSYTLSIDLDRIGEDKGISVPKGEKAKRICDLLDTIQFLYRDIKGRRENLAPIFIVGGVYERKSPYFEDRIKMDKFKIDFRGIEEIINSSEDTKNNTLVGVLDGGFANTKEIKSELCATTVAEVFEKLKEEVRGYYD